MAQNNAWFLDKWDLYRSQKHASSYYFYYFEIILIKLLTEKFVAEFINPV
jgi:hypothetical protein